MENEDLLETNEDLLGTNYIADMIYSYIKTCDRELRKKRDLYLHDESVNMIALYGEWGSGKTRVMKHLKKKSQIDNKYIFLTFSAWHYESSDSIMLSFIDLLLDNVSCDKRLRRKIMKSANWLYEESVNNTNNVFDNFVKSVRSNFETILPMSPSNSFYYRRETLVRFLSDVLSKNEKRNGKKIIVNVDDLERCTPDKVIENLVHLKQIFSLMDQIYYVVSMDRKVILNALDLTMKFSELGKIEVDESGYLEKIFLKSYYMTDIKLLDLRKLIGSRLKEFKYSAEISEVVYDLFYNIGYTNPRKVILTLERFTEFLGRM